MSTEDPISCPAMTAYGRDGSSGGSTRRATERSGWSDVYGPHRPRPGTAPGTEAGVVFGQRREQRDETVCDDADLLVPIQALPLAALWVIYLA